jgi:hypothetical protein
LNCPGMDSLTMRHEQHFTRIVYRPTTARAEVVGDLGAVLAITDGRHFMPCPRLGSKPILMAVKLANGSPFIVTITDIGGIEVPLRPAPINCPGCPSH